MLNRLQSELMALMVRRIPTTTYAIAMAPNETSIIYIYINSYVCVLCGQMSGDSGISAFPEEDNILCWKGTIAGSKDTVFEGTEYKLSLSFPNDYPFKPPNVKFETTCFHPNVDVHGGNICLDILQVIIMPIAMSIHFLCRFQHNN